MRHSASIVVLVAALVGGCPPPVERIEAPEPTSIQRRPVEFEHEACDLTASGAVMLDADANGRPEIIRVFDAGRETCRAVDINIDGTIDVFVYFDAQGRERKRESGFDRDTQPDEISYFENGALVRKERETNNDRKLDTWDYYQNGVLVREERDSSGDGFVNQWWSFNRPAEPACAVVVTDTDGDGRPNPDSEVDLCADKERGPAKDKAKAKEGADAGKSGIDPPADGATPSSKAPADASGEDAKGAEGAADGEGEP